MKKQRTLVTHRQYFGMDAQRLRDSSGRVLSRVVGLAPERARVSAHHVQHDFQMDTVEGQALVDEFVAQGLLQPRSDRQGDYFLTERFVEVASARVVEPLPRPRAKQLLLRAAELAAQLNSDAKTNPFEIESVAVHGTYMSLDDHLDELSLGIVVRARDAARRVRWRRMATNSEGANEIRRAFRELSSFINVQLLKDSRPLPRPFAVVYRQQR